MEVGVGVKSLVVVETLVEVDFVLIDSVVGNLVAANVVAVANHVGNYAVVDVF